MAAGQSTNKLRQWREVSGWTLEEVSGITGVSTAMLSRAERGQRSFSPATKIRIARRLQVSVTDLFEVDPIDVDPIEEPA